MVMRYCVIDIDNTFSLIILKYIPKTNKFETSLLGFIKLFKFLKNPLKCQISLNIKIFGNYN